MSDRYETPEPGSSSWHEPLNENFRAIGEDIERLEEAVGGTGHPDVSHRSSDYESIQAAMDATGGGHLYIDDTKTEEGIKFKDVHDGITIEWVGDNWVLQPENPTNGVPVFQGHGDSDELSRNIELTLTNFRVRNPHLAPEDVGNEDGGRPVDGRCSALEWAANDWTSVQPRRLTIDGGEIRTIPGYGIHVHRLEGSVVCNDVQVYHTAYDAFYFKGQSEDRGVPGEARVALNDCYSYMSGRHGYCIMEDVRYARISGIIEKPYTSGIYIEEEQWTGRTPTRVHSAGTVIRDGVRRTSGPHRRCIEMADGILSGHIRVVNPQNCREFCNRIEGHSLDDFTLIVERDDGRDHNNVGVPALRHRTPHDGGGHATFIVRGEGNPDREAVEIVGSPTAGNSLDIHCEDAPGYSVRCDRVRGSELTIVSRNPCRSGSDTHLYLRGTGGMHSEGNTITLTAIDEDGAASTAIASNGNASDNLLMGNVSLGYTDEATEGLRSSNDTNLLLT